MNFSDAFGSGGDTRYNSTALADPPGTLRRDRIGRLWRAVLAGAADLVAGNVIQSPAQVANHIARTAIAAAIGDTTFSLALGATAAAANQYAGGLAIISVTPGLGQELVITGHLAVLSSGTGVFNLDSATPIQVALTTSSKVDLQANPYRGVIQAPVTTATGVAVGVATSVVTAAQYGYVQTWGPCGVLITGTPAVGASVVGTGAVAGAAAIASSTLGVIGRMMVTGVDTACNAVFLQID